MAHDDSTSGGGHLNLLELKSMGQISHDTVENDEIMMVQTTIAQNVENSNNKRCRRVIFAMLLLMLACLSRGYSYRIIFIMSAASSSDDDDDASSSVLAVVHINDDNGGGEPKRVLCYQDDYLLCYEEVCNTTCKNYDCDGCVDSLVEAFQRCQNESYVNLPIRATIPSEIGLLTHLKSARAASYMTSNFPSELWTLTTLQILDWSDNDVRFDFPTDVGQLTELKTLDFTQTEATGRLWTEIGKLINLEDLEVAWTDLSGTIPTEIGLLTKLTQLSLGGRNRAQLNGTIPTEIGELTLLTSLQLQQTSISGTLPTEIGNLSGLTSLNLLNNFGLVGSVPSQLGNLMNLTKGINLFHTGLSGSIPSQLCSLTFDTDVVETGLLVSCDSFQCECCVDANVPRNFKYAPCK